MCVNTKLDGWMGTFNDLLKSVVYSPVLLILSPWLRILLDYDCLGTHDSQTIWDDELLWLVHVASTWLCLAGTAGADRMILYSFPGEDDTDHIDILKRSIMTMYPVSVSLVSWFKKNDIKMMKRIQNSAYWTLSSAKMMNGPSISCVFFQERCAHDSSESRFDPVWGCANE